MKTKLASVLGLAVLVASFTCGGSLVYADALEAASSTLQTLDADATAAIQFVDAIVVEVVQTVTIAVPGQPAADSEDLQTGSLSEPSATEAVLTLDATTTTEATTETSLAPAIESVDAIVVEVVQTVMIAVPGQTAEGSEEPAFTGSVREPSAAEPISTGDAKATDLDEQN
jgi:hypothetical protein